MDKSTKTSGTSGFWGFSFLTHSHLMLLGRNGCLGFSFLGSFGCCECLYCFWIFLVISFIGVVWFAARGSAVCLWRDFDVRCVDNE